jgi:Flp pilus assembly protein TadG
MRALRSLRLLARNQRGAVMIEPVLIMMSLSAFQVSQIVARQTELQEAASEAAGIALASAPETSAERATLKGIIVASTGLTSDQVTVTEKFRCGTATTYVDSASSCVSVKAANYLLIELDDTYTPIWANWGLGGNLNFNVNRYVLVKQT